MALPELLNYADYRRFLADWFDAKKREQPTFSHRAFARTLGISDAGFLVNVIAERRSLPPSRVRKVAAAIGLDDDRTAYFAALVAFGDAPSRELRDVAWARLRGLRVEVGGRVLDRDQFEVLSRWTYAAVAELIGCRGFRDDAGWIATRLAMTEEDVVDALAGLERAGLIRRGEDGRWVRVDAHVRTTASVQRLAVYGTYRDMYAKAGEALFRVLESEDPAVSAETIIQGTVVALPERELATLRKMMWEMQSKVSGFGEEHAGEADRVFYLFELMFPLSSRTDAPEVSDG